MINLDTSVSDISPIAKKLASRLKKMGVETVRDLIEYYPFRYDDFSQIKDIKDLAIGDIITIKGRVDLIKNRRSSVKRTNITEAIITDGLSSIKVLWFNQPFIIKTIKVGDEIYLSGKVDADYKTLQMVSPEYEKVKNDTSNTARIIPIYPLTQGVTSKQIRYLIKLVLPLVNIVDDWIPEYILKDLNLLGIKSSLAEIHFPSDNNTLNRAQLRLKFNELFLIQLQKQAVKNKIKNSRAQAVNFNEVAVKDFVKKLPFILTDDQRKSAWSILNDLQRGYPMNRLLEGDVGSGKTVVAAIAMLNVALNKMQSAYMAPTEILAKQQFASLKKLFKGFNITIGLLTRTEQKISSVDAKISKKDFFNKIANGEIDIVIGTHALIQNSVIFDNLVFAIIDEQHRFGVEQRKALIEKSGNRNTNPHFLSMTATPIPRTLHLALYGDLDLSIIRQMPKDRKKIITKVVEPIFRDEAYKFIFKQIEEGRQIFVVCPLIDESDKLGVRSVNEEYKKLNEIIFPDIKIGLLHGKLKSEEKESTMQDFLDNKIKILVSTSVIEVGVDIPNATVMMIEGADRFGLAQLHQFRGRVGRSNFQSYCFLFSDSFSENSRTRLEALVDCSDGFTLAEKDLEFRGHGNVYGRAQSGESDLKIATLYDYNIIELANKEAIKLINNDPEFKKFPELKLKVKEIEEKIHLE